MQSTGREWLILELADDFTERSFGCECASFHPHIPHRLNDMGFTHRILFSTSVLTVRLSRSKGPPAYPIFQVRSLRWERGCPVDHIPALSGGMKLPLTKALDIWDLFPQSKETIAMYGSSRRFLVDSIDKPVSFALPAKS